MQRQIGRKLAERKQLQQVGRCHVMPVRSPPRPVPIGIVNKPLREAPRNGPRCASRLPVAMHRLHNYRLLCISCRCETQTVHTQRQTGPSAFLPSELTQPFHICLQELSQSGFKGSVSAVFCQLTLAIRIPLPTCSLVETLPSRSRVSWFVLV